MSNVPHLPPRPQPLHEGVVHRPLQNPDKD